MPSHRAVGGCPSRGALSTSARAPSSPPSKTLAQKLSSTRRLLPAHFATRVRSTVHRSLAPPPPVAGRVVRGREGRVGVRRTYLISSSSSRLHRVHYSPLVDLPHGGHGLPLGLHRVQRVDRQHFSSSIACRITLEARALPLPAFQHFKQVWRRRPTESFSLFSTHEKLAALQMRQVLPRRFTCHPVATRVR